MDEPNEPTAEHRGALRRGWTTGACATAASKSALSALLSGTFTDPVSIRLPGGQTPSFALTRQTAGAGWAEAGIIKDAGDDPDVTHGATVLARVVAGPSGSGIRFFAGDGVGMVTRPGLPIAPGEPAINPVPRKMMIAAAEEVCAPLGVATDFEITISVPGGAEMATKTWNPRLGIVGGISILGTTGIVVPYSCSAWIHSIQRGVDVARAMGLFHLVGATGDTSETAARGRLGLDEAAYIDMGDFVGGFLKYVRKHPVERITIAGGFAKMSKLAEGAMDLHSARSNVSIRALAAMLGGLGASPDLTVAAEKMQNAAEILALAQNARLPLADSVAEAARQHARVMLGADGAGVSVLVVDRAGAIVGSAG